MSTRRPGTCSEPGPYATHCTEDPGHRYSCYDAGDDTSWNDGQWSDFDLAPHDCGDQNCPDLGYRGPEGRESEHGSDDDAPPVGEAEPDISDRAAAAILGLVDTDRQLREPPPVVTHLAGGVIDYQTPDGTVVRQRCSWCGTVLVDACTWLISVPVGQDSTIPTWEVGRFVDVVAPDGRGGMWSANDWTEGPAPSTACLRMPLEVTA